MIYTFIIARPGQKLSQLKRIRTISAVGNTEAEARASLRGLPLILAKRLPDSLQQSAANDTPYTQSEGDVA